MKYDEEKKNLSTYKKEKIIKEINNKKYFGKIVLDNFQPKIKNDKSENLLFAVVKDLYKYSLEEIEIKFLPMIKYLVMEYKLNINGKNSCKETVLYKILSFYNLKEQHCKVADYLLSNFKVKTDTNTKLLLQKNFIPFLKYIYKNIEE